ncbi:hypothetical protein [Chroococcidiopsis sp.]|uniref:hypothetical protein n=1 Tax=Chroococcidiopsis sp. TaxID=3088168 RepID=UPI003F2D4DAA
MVAAKPDCTGQRFGMLIVLGKGGKRYRLDRNCYRQLWRVQCDCGTIVELPRGSFDKPAFGGNTPPETWRGKGQVSCGCKRRRGLVDNKRRPIDISGQKFGSLTAIVLSGKKGKYNQPTWFLKCDCGKECELSLKRIRHKQRQCKWINCGEVRNHPEIHCWYPPTPNPYPTEAGELLAKYLPLTELSYAKIDSAVEDENRDRLLRAAWIITYRRNQGEHISELYEKRLIYKHLRYTSIDVFWRRKFESNGGFLYDVSGNKRELGSTMTDVISNDYPVIETQGIKLLPIKRFKFNRC